jgi:hypothetical protein
VTTAPRSTVPHSPVAEVASKRCWQHALATLAGPIAERRITGIRGAEELRVPVHEAAHAVLGVINGLPVDYVTVIPAARRGIELVSGRRVQSGYSGICKFGMADSLPTAARIALYDARPETSMRDRKLALAAIGLAFDARPDWRELRRLFRIAEAEARKAVAVLWLLIYCVATHLAGKRILDGTEVERIIDDARVRGFDAACERQKTKEKMQMPNDTQQLLVAEQKLNELIRLRSAELDRAQAAAAEAALDAGDAWMEATRGVARLRAEIESASAGIDALRKKRAIAISAERQENVADLRRQAQEKRAEIDKIRRKAEPLLQELSTLEGVAFDHSILAGQRIGDDWQLVAAFGVPDDRLVCNPLEIRNVRPAYAVPRTRSLYEEARALDAKAVEIETQAPRSYGVLHGASAADLVTELYARADMIGPREQDVTDWVARIQAEVQKGSQRIMSVRYHVAWRAGKIEEAESSADVLSPARPGIPPEHREIRISDRAAAA